MLAPTILLAIFAVAADPAARFAERFPGAVRLSDRGGTLRHASGFRATPRAARADLAARAFLSEHGAAFGISPGHELVVERTIAPGTVGAVLFQRRVQGLPVLGGAVAVGVGADGGIFAVNADPVPASRRGGFRLDAAAAARLARAAVAQPRGTLAAETRGWAPAEGVLRPAYRFDLVDLAIPADWRVVVDAESGAVLAREDRLRFARGRVYEESPCETASWECPIAAGVVTRCAPTVLAELLDVAGPSLTGPAVAVYGCAGNPPRQQWCTQAAPGAGGDFDFPSDPSGGSVSDAFAEANAYHHITRFIEHVRTVDPSLPALPRALAFVNVWPDGVPYDNAYWSPSSGVLVFGQGEIADFAYEGEVVSHETTHMLIDRLGGFSTYSQDGNALHEGVADAMAVARTGDAGLGEYVAGPMGLAALRRLDRFRTCAGGGTIEDPGLVGEPHEDGGIWASAFFELWNGLAGAQACGGACNAAAAVQLGALRLTAGTRVSFDTFGASATAAARELFSAEPAISSYVDCVMRRRQIDACEVFRPVHDGETADSWILTGRSSYWQLFPVVAPGAVISACGALWLWGPGGVRVAIARDRLPDGIAPVDIDVTVTARCEYGESQEIALPGAGQWFVRAEERLALAPPLVVRLTAVSGVEPRPTSTPPVCEYVPSFATAPPAPGGAGPSPSDPPTAVRAEGGCGQQATGTAAAGLATAIALAALRRAARRRAGRGPLDT